MSTESTPPPWEEAAQQIVRLLEVGHARDIDHWIEKACRDHAAQVTRERDEARAEIKRLENVCIEWARTCHHQQADSNTSAVMASENASLRAQLKEIFNCTMVDPTSAPEDMVRKIVEVVHKAADKALSATPPPAMGKSQQ